MNALLNYPGSKWRMAKKIVELMPEHHSYLEPFFGSGAVLFHKSQSRIETVNDMDGNVVNFFKVLRDRPDDLAKAISMTPYSREVFEDAYYNGGINDFDRAYKFAIRSKMGHGFKTNQKTGFKIDVHGRERAYAVNSWNRLPADIMQAAERLKQVQIESQPAVDLIQKFNFDNVLIYADPPYLMSTRCCKQYQHEMSERDHATLLAVLKQHKGPVILSGYPSELYDRELGEWYMITQKAYNQNADPRTEVLWMNFKPKEAIQCPRTF